MVRMAERKRGFFGRLVRLGFFAGAAYAVWRAIEANRADQGTTWDPQPFPFPPQPRTDASADDTSGGSTKG
jgi:hypothetical protein